MMNPCKQCIVNPMCKDPCDEAMEHFKIMIDNFKPDHPASIHPGFLHEMMVRIKVLHRSGVPIVINYLDDHKDTDCYVNANNGIILGVERL